MFLLHWPSVHFRIIFLVTVNRLKGKYQVPVVQKVDSAIHWINHYPVDNAVGLRNTIHWIAIYPVDRVIQLLNNLDQILFSKFSEWLKVSRSAHCATPKLKTTGDWSKFSTAPLIVIASQPLKFVIISSVQEVRHISIWCNDISKY